MAKLVDLTQHIIVFDHMTKQVHPAEFVRFCDVQEENYVVSFRGRNFIVSKQDNRVIRPEDGIIEPEGWVSEHLLDYEVRNQA
jgi:hypothetical protein